MSCAQYMKELLRPLGVYNLEGTFCAGELEAQGAALDGVQAELELVERESGLTTAESWGLEYVARLFARRPAASGPRALAEALAALLRIGGDSFTLADINDTISGCGIPAQVEELGTGQVQVSFPGVGGMPQQFEQLRKIIEDILPPHLGIDYRFWYLTWAELEQMFSCWADIENRGFTWAQLEVCIEWM